MFGGFIVKIVAVLELSSLFTNTISEPLDLRFREVTFCSTGFKITVFSDHYKLDPYDPQ